MKFEIFGRVIALSVSKKREPKHAKRARHAK